MDASVRRLKELTRGLHSSPAPVRRGIPIRPDSFLIVTSGTGWVQEWGGERREIKPGDVVWTPPGVKHWHGATATTGMSHIAIQEAVNGEVVEWMEQVSDEQYRGGRR